MSDLVQADALPDRLAYLRRTLDELKAKQTVGQASTVVHRNQSTDPYDTSVTITDYREIATITFTADRQQFGLVDLSLAVYIDSPTTPAVFYDDYYLNIRQMTSDPLTPYLTSWEVDIFKTAAGTHTYYLKATVMATDSGTVS